MTEGERQGMGLSGGALPVPAEGVWAARGLFWLDALPQAVLLYRLDAELSAELDMSAEPELGESAAPEVWPEESGQQKFGQEQATQEELGQEVTNGADGSGPTVLGINRAASELWGVTPERAQGRPLLEVVRRHTLEALALSGGTLELDAAGRTFRCTAERQGAEGALILEDVSLHRRREAELREATAVLSHEFRTPVAALRGVLEALEYDMPAGMQQNFVSQGLQETQRLARLVEDLAVGFRPTRARTVPLGEAFDRAARLLESEHKGCTARLHFGENYLVRADPDKLLQVLLNLVGNALKYGPEGGEVRVTTAAHKGSIEVAVLDTGPAIGDAESLFQAHTRGRHVTGQGSGMGLYIVRSIVQGWGGAAWAERRGEYNAFCFTVPAVSD